MIINTGKKQYKIIRDIFLGAANDCMSGSE